jgi:hypothetical protein
LSRRRIRRELSGALAVRAPFSGANAVSGEVITEGAVYPRTGVSAAMVIPDATDLKLNTFKVHTG